MSTVEVVKMTGLLELSVNQLRFDTDVQCRASIDSGTVTEYKEALTANVVFPPLVVFHDGTAYWVADGFHRGSAYRESGATKCPCDVRQGTKRDAILYAVGANTGHGLRRRNEDKKRAVMTLLNDSEWRQWSDREIARRAGVGPDMVASHRPAPLSENDSQPERKCADGRTINTSNIGKTKPVEKVEAKPGPKPEKVRPAPAGGMASLVGELIREDQEEEDEGQIRILRGEVFRDMKRALLDCWARCPVQFREHLRGMVQYEVGELK